MNIESPLDEELLKKIQVTVPTNDLLEHWFTYHPPTAEDIPRYKEIRKAGLSFARVVDNCCPNSADKTTAIRKIREAVMTANAAIACCGKP